MTAERFPARAAWILIAVAVLVRLPFLCGYGVDDDEYYTLQNAEQLFDTPTPHAVRSYPLTFAVTRLLIELFGLSAFALRLLPVAAGVASVALLLRVGTRLAGARAGTFGALLLALWPWHQYFSGNARYYAPLFLLCLWMIDRLEVVLRQRDGRAVVQLCVASLVGVLVHPTALFALGGAAVLLVPRHASPRRLRVLLCVAGAVVVAGLLVVATPLGEPVRATLTGETGQGYALAPLLAGIGFNVTPVVAVLSVLGVLALRRGGRADAAHYLVASAAAPLIAVVALAASGAVAHPRYVMAGMPALLVLAGAGAASLVPRAAPAAARVALTAALAAPLVPSVVSNLLDGNRHPLPQTAAWLGERLEPGQILFAEGHSLLGFYLFGNDRRLPGQGEPPYPRLFGETPPDDEHLSDIARNGWDARFVIPANLIEGSPAGAYRSFVEWLHQHARVEARFERRRLDYHRNQMVILRTGSGGAS